MKRILIVAAAAFLLTQSLPRTAWAFGVNDVVAMHRDGIPDSLIVAKIHHSGTTFQLNAKDLHALKDAGVSNDIVLAMLKTEDGRRAGSYYGGPYASSWYLGLDFYPDGPYYLGYFPYSRVYAPYYVRGGFGYRGHGFPGRRFR
jgi:hypothetical protein